ncbi:MAG: tRNA (N6-isopentenyl adenosine(37)-C2)-methylthiotransferase MiaB, partial [Thermodesulfovibrionales bacterium]
MKKFYLTTFGCQMNVHDSEKIAGVLSQEGLSMTTNPKEADVIIFNTCSIRKKAEQK